MILCDTNIIIEFYRNNPIVVAELRNIGSTQIAISVITQAELYFGARNKAELQQINRHLSSFQNFPLNSHISYRFIQLMESYTLSHHLSIPDASIAATALELALPLYTLNIKDFNYIPGLKIHP